MEFYPSGIDVEFCRAEYKPQTSKRSNLKLAHNINMRTSPITEPAAGLDVRTLKLRIKRSFVRAPKRGTRTRACYIQLPRKLSDRIVLLMFICCLFIFLRAFFGFGPVDEDLRALNNTFVHPRATLSRSPQWNRGSVASNEDQEMRARGVTRVMVDWHGNYELLPSTTSALVSPASIPQDAFPDPTPALVRGGRGRAREGSLSMTTKVRTSVDIPFTFYGAPYDPFRLEFEDSVGGGDIRGLYPVAGPPRTAPLGGRARRFGRCLSGEACL
jgi:hypothetical protein